MQVDKSLYEEFPNLFEDGGEDDDAAPAEEEDEGEGLDTLDSDLEAAIEEELLKARGTLKKLCNTICPRGVLPPLQDPGGFTDEDERVYAMRVLEVARSKAWG